MCKNAIGSDRNHLAPAINASVLFMIAMVFTVLGGFLLVVWTACRTAKKRAKHGEIFAPAGKLRWQLEDDER